MPIFVIMFRTFNEHGTLHADVPILACRTMEAAKIAAVGLLFDYEMTAKDEEKAEELGGDYHIKEIGHTLACGCRELRCRRLSPRARRGVGPAKPALTRARALFAGGDRSNNRRPRLRNRPTPGRVSPNSLTRLSVKRITPCRSPERRAGTAPFRWLPAAAVPLLAAFRVPPTRAPVALAGW